MNVRTRHVLLAILALPVAAVLVAWLGIIGVGAASGHWGMTDWFLHFAMRSSIRTASLGEGSPPLPREAIRPAAGHFARGCAYCHGAPGDPRSPAILGMLPSPPDLGGRVGDWTDAELHRIVMHGVRFTGMPAWPAQGREDEGWMMTAFLRSLPGLSADDYTALVTAPEGILPAMCSGCHGPDGRDGGPFVPRLAGQNAAYLASSLEAYANGARPSGIMSQALADLAPERRAELARALAALSLPPPAGPPAPPPTVAETGAPARGVPACLSCHGEPRRNPAFPRIDGQPAPYIAAQLRLFRDGERGGGPYAELMRRAAAGLGDDEIESVAEWFASR